MSPDAPDVGHLLDLTDPDVVADPYAALAACRATAPVGWHGPLGMYVATSHAACNAVLRDRALGRIFTAREPANAWDTFNWLHADSILDSEPPKHTRLRRLIAGAFGRGHVHRLAPRIEELAEGLVADCAATVSEEGAVDVIEALAEPLPVLVIAELLGVPEPDRHLLRPWSQAIVRMYEVTRTREEDEAAQLACREFAAYVEALAADRARHPGEDLLSDLVAARDGTDRLSPQELVATAVLLLNAGHEASVNGFGNGLASLLAAGGDFGDPVRLVEEMLRHDSPLHLFERTATHDTVIEGSTSGRVRRSRPCSAPRIAILPSSPSRTHSGPTGIPTRTWPSARAFTSVWERPWLDWSWRRLLGSCSDGGRGCAWSTRCDARRSCCAATNAWSSRRPDARPPTGRLRDQPDR